MTDQEEITRLRLEVAELKARLDRLPQSWLLSPHLLLRSLTVAGYALLAYFLIGMAVTLGGALVVTCARLALGD